MVIVVNRTSDKISVAINSETILCTFSEDTFKVLNTLANEDLQKCTTMVEANAIVDKVRAVVASQGNLSERNFVETACKDHLVYDSSRDTYHLKTKDGKVISKIPLPTSLAQRILLSVEKGIDPTPIVKSVIRFFRNPLLSVSKLAQFVRYIDYKLTDQALYNNLIKEGYSESRAKEAAKYLQTPITLEGLICTYKVSNEVTEKWTLTEDGTKKRVPRYGKKINELTGEISTDIPAFIEDRIFEPAVMGRTGDAFTTKNIVTGESIKDHLYIVGNVHFLDSLDQVNCTDGTIGGGGLHFGNLMYIRGYENANTATHNCFIDPSHIGGFTDKGEGAIRCLQGFLHSSKAGDNRGIYFSSTYAELCDAEWEEMKADAIQKADVSLSELSTANKAQMDFIAML